jgi:pyruvate formate lyase activating enzyme
LSCWWCHNPEGRDSAPEIVYRENRCIRCGACLEGCPRSAISWNEEKPVTDRMNCRLCGTCVSVCYAEARENLSREMTVAQVMAQIERDIPFYDESNGGVTFSGGEPLLQTQFLKGLLDACQGSAIHTTVDTCGYAGWDSFDRIRGAVDLFLYDLKLMDQERHLQFTGVFNEPILRNLRALSECGHKITLRVPIIPGINDDDESLGQLATFAASLPRRHEIELLAYHHLGADKYARLLKNYRLPETQPPSNEKMAQIAHFLQDFGLSLRTGG